MSLFQLEQSFAAVLNTIRRTWKTMQEEGSVGLSLFVLAVTQQQKNKKSQLFFLV